MAAAQTAADKAAQEAAEAEQKAKEAEVAAAEKAKADAAAAEKAKADAAAAEKAKAAAAAAEKAKADAAGGDPKRTTTRSSGKGHIVTGAAVVLKTPDGSERYLYRGATIPAGAFDEKSIKHAVSIGLIETAK